MAIKEIISQSKTVAITGGTGFVAGFVIAEFLNHGYKVKTSLRSLSKFDTLKEDLKNEVKEEQLANLSAFEADLTSEKGWREGFAGCDGVVHVASPLGTGKENLAFLRKAAEGGTLIVLNAAKDVGIKRIVITSSIVCATPMPKNTQQDIDESLWTDLKNPSIDAYVKSKIYAEKAAWEAAKENNLELTTLLPALILGKSLGAKNLGTNNILLQFMNGKTKKSANSPMEISNIGDLAVLHRLAFENKKAVGERFLAASEVLMLPEIAMMMKQRFPNCKVPAKVLKNRTVKFLGLFIPKVKAVALRLDRAHGHTTQKAQTLLGWQQKSAKQTIEEMMENFEKFNLIEF